jgi:hypothetical protein
MQKCKRQRLKATGTVSSTRGTRSSSCMPGLQRLLQNSLQRRCSTTGEHARAEAVDGD